MEVTVIKSLDTFRSLFPFPYEKIGAVDLELHLSGGIYLALSVEEANFGFVIKSEDFKKELKVFLNSFNILLFPCKSTFDALIRFNLLETENTPVHFSPGMWKLNV